MIVDSLVPLAVDIDSVSLMPGNPRRGDVKAVVASLRRFGQRKPIVAKRDGTVIAGNHTLLAARELGWPTIAVTFVDDDDATAKAFALADNRTAELGSYDDDALVLMLSDVHVNAELFAATGWTDHDLEAMLAQDVTGDASTEVMPEMWSVITECTSEAEQVELLERLVCEGYKVRALLS